MTKITKEQIEDLRKLKLIPVMPELNQRQTHVGVWLYGTNDVAEMLDVQASAIRYWVNEGLVEPRGGRATGPGSRQYFTVRNLVEIAILDQLSYRGLKISQMGKVLQALIQEGYFDNLDETEGRPAFVVLPSSGDIVLADNLVQDELVNGHKSMTIIDLAAIERCVINAINAKENQN